MLLCFLLIAFGSHSSPVGTEARHQGVYISPSSGASGGRLNTPALLIEKGDPPLCFDAAVGPTLLESPEVLEASAFGATLHVVAERNLPPTPDPQFAPDISDRAELPASVEGLRADWTNARNDNGLAADVRTHYDEADWWFGKVCLSAAGEVEDGTYLVVAGIQSLDGGAAPPVDDANRPQDEDRRIELLSQPYRIEYRSRDMKRQGRDDALMHLHRARRLGLIDEERDALGRLARIDRDNRVWLGEEADLLRGLGRDEEAYRLYQRAIDACEAVADCPERSEDYRTWKSILRAAQEGQP